MCFLLSHNIHYLTTLGHPRVVPGSIPWGELGAHSGETGGLILWPVGYIRHILGNGIILEEQHISHCIWTIKRRDKTFLILKIFSKRSPWAAHPLTTKNDVCLHFWYDGFLILLHQQRLKMRPGMFSYLRVASLVTVVPLRETLEG